MGISKKEALQAIEREREMICAASDAVWDHPETAFQEFKSTEILCELLEKEGFSVERNLAGIQTAFSGRFGHGKPVVGILGEFDALSGLSQESESIEKVPVCEGEPGHGCGHNLLGAGSVAAAIAVKEYLEKNGKEGTVVFFGCPGEEGGSGKGFMARDGVFDELDFAISWHPGDQNEVSVGSSLANYQVFYRFFGTASHAAACPELGRSALDALELMNMGVQFLREHVVPEARIHYAITNTGGYSPNVVQPYAEVLYLIRAPKNKQVEEIYRRVNKIAEGAAHMTETRVEIDFVKGCSNLVSNKVIAKKLWENLTELGAPEYTKEEMELAQAIHDSVGESCYESIEKVAKTCDKETKKEVLAHRGEAMYRFVAPFDPVGIMSFGSTDVGDVGYAAPTLNINIATACIGNVGHSWQMVAQTCSPLAHKGLLTAAKVMALACVRTMDRPDVIEAAKKEVTKRNGGHYTCPLPDSVMPPLDTY